MKKYTAYIIIFCIGFLSGAAALNLYKISRFHYLKKVPAEMYREKVREKLSETLKREIDLRDEQESVVDTAVADVFNKIDILRYKNQDEAEKIFDDFVAAVKPVLDERQMKKLYEFHDKIKRGPPPPPMDGREFMPPPPREKPLNRK
jgi:hypothetical protein